jgi:hypothetical protein
MLQQAAFAEIFQTDFSRKVWMLLLHTNLAAQARTMHKLCIRPTLVPMLLLLLNELAVLLVVM